MGGLSIWHILVVAIVIIVLFGRGKISGIMEEMGKGINGFKKGLNDNTPSEQPKQVEHDKQKDL
jgi:sec-independent protein translocase protein TatA